MARICLVGDSNVHRHISPDRLSESIGANVTFYPCTRELVFDTLSDGIRRETYQLLVVSVLSNFISNLDEKGFEAELTLLYERFTAKAMSLAPKVLIVPPMLRYNLPWYKEQYPAMLLGLTESCKPFRHVQVLPEFRVVEGDLESDLLHLTPVAGARLYAYFDSILKDLDSNGLLSAPAMKPEASEEVLSLLKDKVLPVLPSISRNEEKVRNFTFHFFISIHDIKCSWQGRLQALGL